MVVNMSAFYYDVSKYAGSEVTWNGSMGHATGPPDGITDHFSINVQNAETPPFNEYIILSNFGFSFPANAVLSGFNIGVDFYANLYTDNSPQPAQCAAYLTYYVVQVQ